VAELVEPRSFLVECYWPGVTEQQLGRSVSQARTAAERLRQHGRDVRLVSSILIPADETVFWLFDGDEADVRAATEQAGFGVERILPSVRFDSASQAADK
jgi:hypothetical protein